MIEGKKKLNKEREKDEEKREIERQKKRERRTGGERDHIYKGTNKKKNEGRDIKI